MHVHNALHCTAQTLVAEPTQAVAGDGWPSENLLSATLCDHPLLVERFRVLSSRLCGHLEQLESLLGGVVHEYTLKYLLRHDLWKGQCGFDHRVVLRHWSTTCQLVQIVS